MPGFLKTGVREGSRRNGGGVRTRHVPILILAAAALVAAGPGGSGEDDAKSTPRQRALAPATDGAPAGGPVTALDDVATASITPDSLGVSAATIGLNFEASRLFTDSGFIPPDTMGAVGPRHIVEIINGNFQIWEKRTGTSLDSRSLNSFWTNIVGLTIPPSPDPVNQGSNFTFDPRIVYDLLSQRWFAVALDRDFGNGNNIYVARSDSSDPTGDWDGLMFVADTVGAPEFHDYETLAVDADGLFMCTQDFGDGGHESCYSIPKADLLQAVPTVANMTRFEATPAGLPTVSGSIQPALNFEFSDGRTPLLGVDGGALRRGTITGSAGPGATLGAVVGIAGDPGHAAPPAARQPHPAGRTIENVAPRFVANVYQLDGDLWAVHAVAGSAANSALRWYRIREGTNAVFQTGLIENTSQDFHEPSIVVNDAGKIVIGYTCSGPNLAPSTCVSIGTRGLPTAFEPPRLVKMGAGHYWQDFADPPDSERNRWGDYSATVIDPVYPCTFWTFQEFVAVSAVGDVGPSPLPEGGLWGTQITELAFDPPVMTIPGSLTIDDTCVGSSRTATLNICNTSGHTGVCANLVVDAITSDDAEFEVVTPSSGYPVVISPDFCFPFQVRYTPSGAGGDTATLTVESNDPTAPTAEVSVSAAAANPDARITGSSDFGDVCAGTLAEKRISVCNVGACNLTVTGADFVPPCNDFKLINKWFPAEVSPDFCMELILRFTPTSAGPKMCTLVIHTDDPDTPDRPVVLTANTPIPSIDVPDDLPFPPTVISSVGACETPLPFPVSNTGTCNLAITDLSITGNPAEYSITGRPSYPILLEPGHIAGEGDLRVVFGPDTLDRDLLGQLSVTWVSDPITGATSSASRALCGEGTRTGARVLVRAGGVPVPMVESLKIQRINANRNRNLLDTVENARDLPLQAVIPAPPCGPFQFHREYSTVSNPIQLLPGSYQITATVRVGGKRMTKTVGFDVSTCTFNPTIIIDF